MEPKIKVLEKDYKEFVDTFWLNLGDTTQIRTGNVFATNEYFRESPIIGLVDILRQPKNFAYTCQVLFNVTILPFQSVVLQALWNHHFPMLIGSRGFGKTFLMALYILLLALFKPGSKIVITGSSFRQAKIVFSYCEAIWKNAPLFRDILSVEKTNRPLHDVDMYQFRIGTSVIYAVPTGTGNTIRGLRASCLLCDEFNSIDVQIFEEIMQGFSSVSMDPVANVKQYSKLEALKVLGKITKEQADIEASTIASNQTIISGTCGYTFEHLYKYWKRHHDIIMTGGDIDKLKVLFNGEPEPGFNWRDYVIVRMPYDVLPKGYMDLKTIGKAKATTSSPIFGSEYGAIFQSDSLGFFRRTLIEKCTARNTEPPLSKPSCGIVDFNAMLKGIKDGRYVMAVDPAAEEDNFAIVILEIQPDHRRIVYCWTVNKEKHKLKLRAGLAKEHDYFRFCCRKMRDLMKAFRIEAIAIDAQGGGGNIREILGDPNYLEHGEYPLYEIEEFDVDKDTDGLVGLHILHMIQFVNASWTTDANENLRLDMETQEIVFPLKDSLAFGLAREEDKIFKRIKFAENEDLELICDTAEDCLLEIEELKNELVLIEYTKTPSGRGKWDTPQVKGLNTKKGRLRKDRYSALLMANAVGRVLINRVADAEYSLGGMAHNLVQGSNKGDGSEYGMAVQRGRRY